MPKRKTQKTRNNESSKKKKKSEPNTLVPLSVPIAEPIPSKSSAVFDAIKNEFTCSICQDVVIKAHGLTCSHMFCEYCIKRWLTKNSKCPFCRERTAADRLCPIIAVDKVLEKYFEDQPQETQDERKKNIEEREKSRPELDRLRNQSRHSVWPSGFTDDSSDSDDDDDDDYSLIVGSSARTLANNVVAFFNSARNRVSLQSSDDSDDSSEWSVRETQAPTITEMSGEDNESDLDDVDSISVVTVSDSSSDESLNP